MLCSLKLFQIHFIMITINSLVILSCIDLLLINNTFYIVVVDINIFGIILYFISYRPVAHMVKIINVVFCRRQQSLKINV